MTLPVATSFLISALWRAARMDDGEVVLSDGVNVGEVLGRSNDDHEERVAVHSRAHINDLHLAAALLLDEAVVFDDLVPASHLTVGAKLEPEEFIWWRNTRLRQESRGKGEYCEKGDNSGGQQS